MTITIDTWCKSLVNVWQMPITTKIGAHVVHDIDKSVETINRLFAKPIHLFLTNYFMFNTRNSCSEAIDREKLKIKLLLDMINYVFVYYVLGTICI